MSTSNLKFYQTELKPGFNAYVDDIESYLESVGGYEIEDFQYIKHNSSIIIKVQMSQSEVDTSTYNYVRIANVNLNVEEDPFYYFIVDRQPLATNTVAFTLILDSINSCGIRPDEFLPLTAIERQHGDRFHKPNNFTGKLTRRIDYEAEGFSPVVELQSTETIYDDAEDNNWYLVYRTRDNLTADNIANPIEVLLCPETTIQTTGSWVLPHNFTLDELLDNYYYYFSVVENPAGQIQNIILGQTALGQDRYAQMAMFWKENNQFHIKVWCTETTDVNSDWTYDQQFDVSTLSITTGSVVRGSTSNIFKQGPSCVYGLPNRYPLGATLGTIDTIDRTDSQIMKIIKYPYCPVSYYITSNTYVFDSDWVFTSGYLKYNKSVLPKFLREDIATVDLDEYLVLDNITPTYTSAKDIKYESKLYHSDITTFKVYYDSFATTIAPERLSLSYLINYPRIDIDFKASGTMSSTFGFKVNAVPTLKKTSDFEDFIIVTRNNEESIYSSDYLNYIRNGYNYDRKQNALAITGQVVNMAIQAVAAIATSGASVGVSTAGAAIGKIVNLPPTAQQFMQGQYTGSPKLRPTTARSLSGEQTAVGGLTTQASISKGAQAASAAVGLISTIAKQQIQMAEKLQSLQSQAIQVAGSDDVDLMTWYSDNKLKFAVYRPRKEVLEALRDVFDYLGYVHIHQEVPEVDSRIWYNYIQCDPVIEVEGIEKARQPFLEDLKQRYNEGVTVFHHNNLGGQYDTWDFKQQYENFETWMFE